MKSYLRYVLYEELSKSIRFYMLFMSVLPFPTLSLSYSARPVRLSAHTTELFLHGNHRRMVFLIFSPSAFIKVSRNNEV